METWRYTNHSTTLLQQHVYYARSCQGKHFEMPQLATVSRALRLITESTGVVPSCQCLTLRLSGRSEGGTGRHWAVACWGGCGGRRGPQGHRYCQPRSEKRALCGAPHQSWELGHSTGDSKGIVPVLPAGNSESLPSTDFMWITYSTGFCSRKKNLSQKLLGTSILQFASSNYVISHLFIYFARTDTLPTQDPACRAGASVACVVSHMGQHPVVPWSPKQTQTHIGKQKCKITLQ